LGSFLTGEALAAFNSGNPGYFSLPAFSDNSNILVSQLRYYPGYETDPDLLETGGGRDVVTGEQGQIGCVGISYTINGSASQEAYYEMGLSAGQWKIVRRLSSSCTEPPPPLPPPTPVPPPPPTPIPTSEAEATAIAPFIQAVINGPETALVCQEVSFSGSTSEPVDQISAYEWSFGDGSTGSGSDLTYTYTNPGIYTVTLVVRDITGQSSPPASHLITITPPPPPPCGPLPCCK
jgi:hypothetical protein